VIVISGIENPERAQIREQASRYLSSLLWFFTRWKDGILVLHFSSHLLSAWARATCRFGPA
jgi:hypothetical protein